MIDELKARLHRRRRLPSAAVASGVGLLVLVGTVYAGAPLDAVAAGVGSGAGAAGAAGGVADEPAAADVAHAARDLSVLEDRVERVNGAWADLARYYDSEVAPLERVLSRYSADSALVERIAVSLVREANRVDIEPRLLLAVLLVENPWLDPDIRSPVGAIGLMQVMPVHRGGWSECGSDLEDVESNICYGAHIFAHYFERTGEDLDRALLRYNGCVNGTNTPDCHRYPDHVFANAGRVSVMAWIDGGHSR